MGASERSTEDGCAAQPLRWGRGPLPVIRNIHVLCDADAFLCQCLEQRVLLHDSSAPTILELSEGNWGGGGGWRVTLVT